MPRVSRKFLKSSYYHVIVQGINKEYIFNDKNEIYMYKYLILKKLKESKVKILAYCIMNNHTHFLMYSKEIEDLSKYMQKLNTAYSRFYNSYNNRVGYVFRDRFYSQEIISKKQLYNCLRYIHNNPVKAKICKRPENYEYSSYNEFMKSNLREIIDIQGINLLFETNKKFKEQFLNIHNSLQEDEFYDIKDKSIKDYIKESEIEYGISLKYIKEDKKKLKQFIKNARKETDVTIQKLAEILGISKTTVGRYSKMN